MILAVGDTVQPLCKRLVCREQRTVLGKAAFFQSVQCSNLAGNDTNDQPVIADLDEYDTFARAQRYATDNLYATLSESLASGYFAGQPGRCCKQGDNQCKGKTGLQVRAGRNARRGSLTGMGKDWSEQEK